MISKRYLFQETERQLQAEAKTMSQLLSKTTLSNKTLQEKFTNRKTLVITERLLTANIIIWTENQEIIYTDIKGVTLKQIIRQSKGPQRKYVSAMAAIPNAQGMKQRYVTLVTKVDDIKAVNQLMRRSQLNSFVISAFVAILLSVFFEKSLTKPIRKLTKHLRNYPVRGAYKEISIDSKDEIGVLADSFNTLARQLKRLDEEQKAFFHNASHELKTPLMAIQGNAEGILDGVVKGNDVDKSLQVIISESQRLKKLVEGITYLAKLENATDSFSFGRHSLGKMIQEALQSIKALAEQKQINILVENNVEETVPIDKDKMKRALINLVGNAIRYAESTIEIISYAEEEKVIMIIKDDGKGFAQEEENKVFQRFYSGDAGGSGIGLAITKSIIEGHNGSIKAYNNKPKGAVFEICLPK